MKAERIILLFYCTINIVQYLIVSQTGIYISDALGSPVDSSSEEQFAILVASLGCCLVGYQWYVKVASGKIRALPNFRIRIKNALVAGLVMTFVGFVFFDYGRAETSSTLPFGFVFRVIPLDLLFAYYFCFVPLNERKSYILVGAYLALKIAMGWTGMFAGIFWTLFIRIINANAGRKKIGLIAFLVLIAAFLIAPTIYSVKFYIRWGSYEFAYLESLTRLVGRIGFYSNALYLYEQSAQFSREAAANLSAFSYLKDAAVAILPRSLLGLHGQNMETVFVNYVTGDFVAGITFYLGLLGKIIAYGSINPLHVPLVLGVVILLSSITFRLAHATVGRSANPVIFVGIFQIFLSGSIEELSFGLYSVALIYLICAFRVFPKVYKRSLGAPRYQRPLAATAGK